MKTYSKRQKHKARGVTTWYLRCYENGQTSYTSLRTSDAKQAQKVVDKMNSLRWFPELAKEEKKDIPINKAVIEFLDQAFAVTPKSYSIYKSHFDTFRHFCSKMHIKMLTEFNENIASTFVKEFSSIWKASSLHNKIIVFRTFFKRSIKRYKLSIKNPFADITLPRIQKSIKDFWTMEQIDTLINVAPNPQLRFVWSLMAYAGLRISEATNVKEKDFTQSGLFILGKGGKEAYLPVSDKLKSELERFKQLGNWAKLALIHKSRSTSSLHKACKLANVPEGSWCSNHKLRHSFASNLARNGCPIKITQTLLRHSSSSMTLDVYTHVMSDDVKEWVDKI